LRKEPSVPKPIIIRKNLVNGNKERKISKGERPREKEIRIRLMAQIEKLLK